MTPTVSIVVPTFNRANSLRSTLRAMMAQTYEDWELIVCDDASTDNTQDVVESIADSRVRYHRNLRNLGIYPNWNEGIRLSRGQYVAIYHDHDFYAPTIVARSVELLERHPSASFVHTALVIVDPEHQPLMVDVRPFPELIPGAQLMQLLANTWSSPIMAATAMVRRAAYDAVGLYDPSSYGLGCDLDMWFRLAQVGDVAYVKEPQAKISGRRKGDTTARFRWSTVLGDIRMRSDHVEKAFPRGGWKRFVSRRRYIISRDVMLLRLMLRAILLEPPAIIEEGVATLEANASPIVERFSKIVWRSRTLQAALRRTALPLHYAVTRSKTTLTQTKAKVLLRQERH